MRNVGDWVEIIMENLFKSFLELMDKYPVECYGWFKESERTQKLGLNKCADQHMFATYLISYTQKVIPNPLQNLSLLKDICYIGKTGREEGEYNDHGKEKNVKVRTSVRARLTSHPRVRQMKKEGAKDTGIKYFLIVPNRNLPVHLKGSFITLFEQLLCFMYGMTFGDLPMYNESERTTRNGKKHSNSTVHFNEAKSSEEFMTSFMVAS
jgi:hypothetical protein